MKRYKIVPFIILLLGGILVSGASAANLVIENGDKSFELTLEKDGDLKVNQPINPNVTEFKPSGVGLFIEYDGDTKAMADKDGLDLKDVTKTITTTVSDALYISHEDNKSGDAPQASLDQNGTLNITGTPAVKGQPVKTVAYFDDFVFEQKAGTELEIDYITIVSPNGVEGRVEDPYNENKGTTFFYVKDHLGSTQMVLYRDKDGAGIAEAARYSPYGKELGYIVEPSSDLTREKFTGKELDKEGAVDYSELILDINIVAIEGTDYYETFKGADGAYVTVHHSNGTEMFTLKGEEYPSNGQVPTTYNFRRWERITFYEPTTINNIEVRIKNSKAEPVYDVHYSINGDLDEEIEPNTEKKVALTANEAALRKAAQEKNTPSDHVYAFSETECPMLAGIGLNYFGARYYDPEIGVWMSPDPKRVGWNVYSYVEGNPTYLVDPNGENPLVFVAVGALVLGALYGGISLQNQAAGNPEPWDLTRSKWWDNANIQGPPGGVEVGIDSDRGPYVGERGGERNYIGEDEEIQRALNESIADFNSRVYLSASSFDVGLYIAASVYGNMAFYRVPHGLKFGDLSLTEGKPLAIDDLIWGRLGTFEILSATEFKDLNYACKEAVEYMIKGGEADLAATPHVALTVAAAWDGMGRNLSRTPVSGADANIVWWPGLNFPATESSHVGIYWKGIVFHMVDGQKIQEPFMYTDKWARGNQNWLGGARFMPVSIK